MASSFTNTNIKMGSFKSSKNFQMKKGAPDKFVSDNQSFSVTLNELAIKARKTYSNCNFDNEVSNNEVTLISTMKSYND